MRVCEKDPAFVEGQRVLGWQRRGCVSAPFYSIQPATTAAAAGPTNAPRLAPVPTLNARSLRGFAIIGSNARRSSCVKSRK